MRADDVRDFFESVDAQPSAQFSDALLARLQAEHLFAHPDASRDAEHLTLEPILIDLLDEEPRRPNRRRNRRRIAVAGAVAATVVVVTGVLVGITRDDRVEVEAPGPAPASTTVPPPTLPSLPAGLTGLPPEGAIPSTPATGQLLAPLTIPIWVYEDGRVISARWTTSHDWTGFLEQRLTPEGVALVRAEILANEPFTDCRAGMGVYGYWDAARMVCEQPGRPTYAYPEDAQHPTLSQLPDGAPSWLPASAWVDPEPKPYVPSTYEVQISTTSEAGEEPPPIDASAMIAALPPEAAELLTAPMQCAFPAVGEDSLCFKVTTETARQLVAALGITGTSMEMQGFLGGVPLGGSYAVGFLPYLPHDSPVWCCGG